MEGLAVCFFSLIEQIKKSKASVSHIRRPNYLLSLLHRTVISSSPLSKCQRHHLIRAGMFPYSSPDDLVQMLISEHPKKSLCGCSGAGVAGARAKNN